MLTALFYVGTVLSLSRAKYTAPPHFHEYCTRPGRDYYYARYVFASPFDKCPRINQLASVQLMVLHILMVSPRYSLEYSITIQRNNFQRRGIVIVRLAIVHINDLPI